MARTRGFESTGVFASLARTDEVDHAGVVPPNVARPEYELVVRSEYPEWWHPKLDTRQDHVRRLVAWRARRLREQGDAR